MFTFYDSWPNKKKFKIKLKLNLFTFFKNNFMVTRR